MPRGRRGTTKRRRGGGGGDELFNRTRSRSRDNKFVRLADRPGLLGKEDVKCPICWNLLNDPVTMPCGHSACLLCFGKHVGENGPQCPCCRQRMGGWMRWAEKVGELEDYWLKKRIEEEFPEWLEEQLIVRRSEEDAEEKEQFSQDPSESESEPEPPTPPTAIASPTAPDKIQETAPTDEEGSQQLPVESEEEVLELEPEPDTTIIIPNDEDEVMRPIPQRPTPSPFHPTVISSVTPIPSRPTPNLSEKPGEIPGPDVSSSFHENEKSTIFSIPDHNHMKDIRPQRSASATPILVSSSSQVTTSSKILDDHESSSSVSSIEEENTMIPRPGPEETVIMTAPTRSFSSVSAFYPIRAGQEGKVTPKPVTVSYIRSVLKVVNVLQQKRETLTPNSIDLEFNCYFRPVKPEKITPMKKRQSPIKIPSVKVAVVGFEEHLIQVRRESLSDPDPSQSQSQLPSSLTKDSHSDDERDTNFTNTNKELLLEAEQVGSPPSSKKPRKQILQQRVFLDN